jgi:hypothetical protein
MSSTKNTLREVLERQAKHEAAIAEHDRRLAALERDRPGK